MPLFKIIVWAVMIQLFVETDIALRFYDWFSYNYYNKSVSFEEDVHVLLRNGSMNTISDSQSLRFENEQHKIVISLSSFCVGKGLFLFIW